MEAVIWIGLVVILLIIEALTMGLTTIWFAGGAVIAFLAALLGAPVALQAGLFIVISALLLIFTRPAAAKFMNHRIIKTNVDSLIGSRARVIETVDNIQGTGRVMVNGVDWKAKSSRESEIISKDTVVEIQKVDGVKLIVNQTMEE
jgi:membrane protein implicated in regulation of membrane protease activity